MCYAPVKIRENGEVVRVVACRHCLQCVRRRTMSWTLRLLLEATEHEFTDFVTLTYDPQNLPQKLPTEHFVQFIKRLRRSTPRSVRYFCCGEYGGKTARPHWHVLLFGHRLPDRGLHRTELWPYGHVFTGEIERPSAQYVANYSLKSTKTAEQYITRMSRRPGIGMRALSWIARKSVQTVPKMEYWPPIMRFGGKTYWLDPRAYEKCASEYVAAGGELTYEVAPCNDALDVQDIRAMPVDTWAREYMKCFRSNKH